MILAISHQKGGVGKSTIAYNLSVALQKKYNVIVLDLDVQQSITQINKLRLENKKLKPLDVRYVKSEEELKNYIKNEDEETITVIDTGGFDSSLNRIAIYLSDVVITPVADTFTELAGLMKYKEILHELETISGEKMKVNLLLNNINPNSKKFEEIEKFCSKHASFSLLKSKLRRFVDYDKAAWEGKNAIEYNKESKASKDLKHLTNEIIQLLKEGDK
jgi:chromosome partitioning protein